MIIQNVAFSLLASVCFFFPCFAEEYNSVSCKNDFMLTMEMDTTILYNVITPNGDGRNDVLRFDDLGDFSSVELYVFNSWGHTVYENVNYNNDWGGTKDGNPLPAGSYFYILKLDGTSLSSAISIIYE